MQKFSIFVFQILENETKKQLPAHKGRKNRNISQFLTSRLGCGLIIQAFQLDDYMLFISRA